MKNGIRKAEAYNMAEGKLEENEIFKPSISEENGVKLVNDTYKNILSIGISTAGSAEIEMSKRAPNSHIIATTIDKDGLEFSRKIIEETNHFYVGKEKEVSLLVFDWINDLLK